MLCSIKKNLGEHYTPMYFLGALGAGGLSVSFYMFLHWMVDHPNVPFATADFVYPLIEKMNFVSILILISMAMFVYLAYAHFRLLIWNFSEYFEFKKTEGYTNLMNSNSEVTLMAIPLTLAMTINVCFIIGALFIPKLWNHVESLFPFSLGAFFIVGVYALYIYMRYAIRIISNPSFDFSKNNNLSQLIAPFAFSMVAVGFSAPGAMSHHKETYAFGMFFAIFFSVITISLCILILIIGFKNILEHGLAKEAGVSLWTMIPILTLLGITFYRLTAGFSHNMGATVGRTWYFLLTSTIESFQWLFLLLGLVVMQSIGYFSKYIFGPAKSVTGFAIVCPGVAFVVFGFFFVNGGLVQSKVITKYSVAYFIIHSLFWIVQAVTTFVLFKLNNKLFSNDVDEQLPP